MITMAALMMMRIAFGGIPWHLVMIAVLVPEGRRLGGGNFYAGCSLSGSGNRTKSDRQSKQQDHGGGKQTAHDRES
ncbi:MAG: hypothetical protein ABIP18_03425 [Steroidobacteraceae bacterium]